MPNFIIKGGILHVLLKANQVAQKIQVNITFDLGIQLEKNHIPTKKVHVYTLYQKICEHLTEIDFMCNYPKSLTYIEQSLGPL